MPVPIPVVVDSMEKTGKKLKYFRLVYISDNQERNPVFRMEIRNNGSWVQATRKLIPVSRNFYEFLGRQDIIYADRLSDAYRKWQES